MNNVYYGKLIFELSREGRHGCSSINKLCAKKSPYRHIIQNEVIDRNFIDCI